MSLSPAAERLLRALEASIGGDCWVTPAESLADAWVLLKPFGLPPGLIAVMKVPERAITELAGADRAAWTAADENVPSYLCGLLSREYWFRGRKGRRIDFLRGVPQG